MTETSWKVAMASIAKSSTSMDPNHENSENLSTSHNKNVDTTLCDASVTKGICEAKEEKTSTTKRKLDVIQKKTDKKPKKRLRILFIEKISPEKPKKGEEHIHRIKENFFHFEGSNQNNDSQIEEIKSEGEGEKFPDYIENKILLNHQVESFLAKLGENSIRTETLEGPSKTLLTGDAFRRELEVDDQFPMGDKNTIRDENKQGSNTKMPKILKTLCEDDSSFVLTRITETSPAVKMYILHEDEIEPSHTFDQTNGKRDGILSWIISSIFSYFFVLIIHFVICNILRNVRD